MNRQTKRMLQRQGQLAADGSPLASGPPASPVPARREPELDRLPLGERIGSYFGEVKGELSKVLWPRRPEVVNYSTVVLTTLVLLALLIFGLNYAFAKGVMVLFR